MMTDDQATALLKRQVKADPDAVAEILEAFAVWCQVNWTAEVFDHLANGGEQRGWNDCLDSLDTAARHVIGAMP
jgi:hypothetical protein